jgi:drug/metabolite transporter (DMT)-like permease
VPPVPRSRVTRRTSTRAHCGPVKPEYIVYVLTFLSAVVVVLTRVRLSQARAAGQHQVGMGTVNTHSSFGVVALLLWAFYLVTGHDRLLVGISALFFYWLTALVGLLILLRWVPSRGKHASDSTDDRWSEGPGLSVLAHVGMLVGVLVFTWFYATQS